MVSKQWLLNTQKKLVTQRSVVIAASFLKAKKCVCQHDEAERAAMDETPPTDETHKEDLCEALYKECFFNYENYSADKIKKKIYLKIFTISKQINVIL
jgi:hypothetical protein